MSALVQRLLHYTAKIWIHQHPPPLTQMELAQFPLERVIADYRNYFAAGERIPLDQGLDLEESYLLAQVVAQRPLQCLLNLSFADLTTPSVRMSALQPEELVNRVAKAYRVRLQCRRDVAGQLERWGKLCPAHTALVWDGETGHCVMIVGIDKGTERVVYWDPWPLLSLLCAENNVAGVDAQPVSSGEPFWTISKDELAQVIVAVFIQASEE